jgi:hypothetical protein
MKRKDSNSGIGVISNGSRQPLLKCSESVDAASDMNASFLRFIDQQSAP